MSLNKVMKKFMAIALSVFLLTTQCSWSFATIGSWSDFKYALESGISDDLSANISYNGTSQITANKNATIDLGNHTITGTGSNKNAIQATANNLRFIDGTFTGFNRTTEWGSILHLTTNGNVTFNGTRFLNNSSLEAGALSSGTKGSHLTIQNALFQGNSANAIGAVGAFTGTTIENTIFRNNNSTDTTGAYDESGGALFLGAVSTTDIGNSVNGSTFENNTSGTSGGAIATRRADLADNSAAKLDIVNTTFTSNVAGTQGGAIDNYFYNDSANSGAVKVASSAFTSNTAADGGAIYNHGELDKAGNAAAMHIVDSTFTGNHATNLGGAIFNAGTLVLSGTNSFSNNYDGYGTANQRKNDIYNTGFLEINGTAILDGGIHGAGEVDVKGNISFTENADIEQETFVVEEGKTTENAGTASFEQLQGDGTFQNTGTLNLDLSNTGDYSLAHLVDGSTPVGQTNIHVGAGKTVEITPTEFVQKKVVTTGEGHLRVAGDIEAEFENQMTGTSVEIASLIDGPFTNIAGANAEFVDGAAITGLITNNGTIGIYNTTNYDVQANMTGNSSTVPANILNIGGEYNSIQYTSNVSVGKAGTDSDIANQTINVVDGTLTLFDDGANYGSITNSVLNILADGAVVANASKIDTVDDTIANAGLLTFTGGINSNEVNGTGATVFSNTVTNNADITQNSILNKAGGTLTNNGFLLAAITNENTATLLTDPDNLGGDVANAGQLTFTEKGTLSVNVTGAGVTDVTKDLSNEGYINQKNINVASGAVVTTNADDFKATDTTDGIVNAGTINYTGGTNTSKMTGTGRVDMTGYVTNAAGAIIEQGTVTNSGVFTNEGAVIADNFKNTNEIAGAGTITTSGTGISSNSGTIAQKTLINNGTFDNTGHITLTNVLTNNGTFNTNADLIAATNGIANTAGDFNITGGTLAATNAITGDGTTNFTGDATNNATIAQTAVTNSANLTNNAAITATDVVNSGTLTSAADLITITNNGQITNTGTYNITDGDNANVIFGTGTTNILGDTVNENDGVSTFGFIQQNNLNIATSGSLTTSSENVIAAIDNAGTLTFNAGAANGNVITGTGKLHIKSDADITNTNSITQGAIKITDGGKLTSDANLLATTSGITNNVAEGLTFTAGTNTNAITGGGTTVIDGTVANEANIGQNVSISGAGTLTSNADLMGGAIANAGIYNVTGGTNNSVISNALGTTNFTGDATNEAAITQYAVTNSANLTNNAVITAEAITNTGTLTSLGNNINGALANSGTYNITNGDNGIAITGTGTTNILGTTSNSGTITQDKVVVGNVGNFTTSANTVTAAIENQGTMTWNGGTSNNNAVTGDGKLNITGGTIANNAAISQDKITIAGGILTTNADLLATANGIVNDTNGGLVLTGGTNNNAITGLGVLVSNGNVFNQASIAQDSMSVNGGTFTSDASLLAFAHGITNDSNISLTGGTNTNTIDGTGITYIDGNVENTGTIKTNIGVGTSGYYATSSDVEKVLANNGVVDLQNGADITSTGSITGSGTTNILGLTLNDGTITQSNLNIASNGIFYTDIGDVTASINNEGEMFWDGSTAVNNDNVVSGTGAVTITGGSDVNNRAAISQSKIIIDNGSLTSNADLLSATESIYNDDVLTFTGGTNTNAIGGTGSMSINGNVINLAAVTQDDLSIDGGKFTTDAGSLTIANGITLADNTGLSFTGGDNTNDISGTGMVYIDGTVQNEADIQTKITVNTGAHYGTATDVYKKLDNRGITDLVDADVLASGKISGTGTTNILGTTVVEDGASIEQTALNISANGSLTTNSQSVQAAIANEGMLIWNAGNTNANDITGQGTLTISNGNIANTGSISQGKLAITGGSLTSDADLLAFTGGINNAAIFTLTDGTNINVVKGSGDMNITGEVINTALIEQDSLTVTNTGDFTNNGAHITVTDTIMNNGMFTNAGGLITGKVNNATANSVFITDGTGVDGDITNNGDYYITDGDNDNKITGTGNLYIQGSTTNTEVVTQEKMAIANGATFVATDMDAVTLNTAIDNAGTLEMQSGTNSNKIQGTTGTLNVTGAVTHAAGKTINQDTINIATLGEFTIEDIDDVTTVDGIASTGKLILQGAGINLNDISGTGNIQVDAAGVITNQGNIEQSSLDNDGKFTSDADLLAFANGIDNSNELNLTGGTNENVITNATGTTNFTNNVVNNAAITQATVTNAAGTLTNNADINATTFTNDTGTVNNEAIISAAITNNVGGTLNSAADNLAGAVVNDGTLNVAGGVVFDTITGTGDMYINDDLINDEDITQTNITNSANFTNSGAISATLVTNSGVIDNTETITATNKIDNTATGIINSKADYLNAAVSNAGVVNLAGGTTQNTISGTGDTNVTADLTLAHLIDQATITNAEGSTITGKASNLVATNEIDNSGTLAFNAASTGSSKINGTGNVEVTADTILTAQNGYEGGTLIGNAAGLLVAGQKNIGTGDVTFAGNGYLAVGEAGTLTSNLLGATATDDIKVINTDALTVEGSINDAADFHKDGVGDMTFTMASNSYAGDTYVDDGKLIGNAQNINNAVLGKAGTIVEFNDTVDAELNEINTLGTFVKSGSALLNVQNNSFTALQADINKGIFAANTALTATTMNVNDGATLRGNGNITGTVNVKNGATIAPGNSIDTLTITGDLNLAGGSTTAIEINETPASDKIVVTQTATIDDGAKLTVTNENGRYFEWKEFEILNANDVTGTFTYDGTVADYDASRIDVALDYSDPTKVLLTAKRKATDYEHGAVPAAEGLSRNQKEVAHAMDSVSTGFGGDITNALLQLEKLGGLNPEDVTLINPNSTLKSALSDMTGVLYANSALLTLFNSKTSHVYDRIAKRNPSTGSCPTCHDNVWVEYYNQHDKVYADANSPRFTNNMNGVLVGYDRSSEDVLLGVYTGYSKSDMRQSADTMDIEDTTLGVYAGWRPGDWIFKGTLYGGYQSYEGERHIEYMNRTATGAYKGWNLALDLEGAYNVPVYSWLNVKPFVGALANYSYQQSFTEKGADSLNLHVASKDLVNTQARFGVQFDGKIQNKLSWYGSVAVKQFIGNDYAKLRMTMGLPGTRMEIISAELGRTYFSSQVGLNYAFNNNWSMFGNLDMGVNNKSTNCYGNIGVAYTW